MLCLVTDGLQVLLWVLLMFSCCCLTQAETLVTVRKVTHPSLRQPLAGSALLPCVFTLSPAVPPSHGPYIHWTRGSGEQERTVLFARDGVVRIHQAYAGRVSLPGYSVNQLNASLALSHLRSNDSGIFRCHVALGDKYEQDTVNLEITGVVFHYRAASDRYSLSFDDAVDACEQNSGDIAAPEHLWAAFHSGLNSCAAGWLKDQTVRYPIQRPELGCYGHTEYSRGVRNYGKRDPSELFDVYCFANEMKGEVFSVTAPGKLTHPEAAAHCESLGGRLATVGQLYLAWTSGLDHCDGGWLADGSVRSSVGTERSRCADAEPGVRTFTPSEPINRTDRFDAYCYQEKKSQDALSSIVKSLLKPWKYMTGDVDGSQENAEDVPESPSSTGEQDLSDLQPTNWTGQVDLDKELHVAAEPPELSAEYLTVRLRAEDTSLDWSGQLDSFPDIEQTFPALRSDLISESPGGSAREEEDEDLSGQSVTETTQSNGKSSLTSIVSSLWKPWRYLTGGEVDTVTESTQAVTQSTVMDNKPTATSSSGLMSLLGTSRVSGLTSVTDKFISSHPPVSSTVPETGTRDRSSIDQASQATEHAPGTGEEWVQVTEKPGENAGTPDPDNEEEVPVSISKESVRRLSLTESYSGESRTHEMEGSSWGDTYLSPGATSEKTLTVVTLNTGLLPERRATTSLNQDDAALEARGEIQYRRRNKGRRPGHRTTEMTTTAAQSTTMSYIVSSTSENTRTAFTLSPDKSQMASFQTPVLSITDKDLNIPEKDLTITEKDLTITEKDLTITEKDLTITGKDLSNIENDLAITEKDLTITDKDLSNPEEDLSSPEEDLSNPKKDLTVTEKDLSSPEEDLSNPKKDLPITEKDLSSEVKDLSSPEEDLSNPKKDLPITEKDLSSEVKDLSSPEEDLSNPKKDLPITEKDLSSEVKDLSSPEEDLSNPKKDLTVTEKDLSSPEEDLSNPEEDHSNPKKDLTVTEKDLSSEEKDLSNPKKDVTITEKNLTITEKDLSSPEEDLSNPQKDLTVTEKDLSSPEEDLSNPQKDLTVTEKDLSSPEEDLSNSKKYLTITEKDLSSPEEDLSNPQKDLTVTEKDLSSEEKDLSGPEEDLSNPKKDVTITEKNLTITEKDLSSPEEDLSNPQKDLTVTEKDLSSPEEDLSNPQKDLTVTEKDLSSPEEDLSNPKKDLTITEKDLSSPKEDLSNPDEDLSNPDEDLSNPDEDLSNPEEDLSNPEEDLSIIEKDLNSPESSTEMMTNNSSLRQRDIDDCQSNPCENGGTCIDKEDSFVCLCLPSYTGDQCERDTEGCEHGWMKFHAHCYRLFSRRHTWEESEKDCREHSSHLTSITSSLEQDFLNGLGHENIWIGLNDRTVEEDFQWTDGLDVVYENWRESQPDNFFAGGEDCVVMISREDGKWNDVPCNYNLPYVCKKGTVMCNTPPSVDNAYLVGRRRSHYDIHAVVRYQCDDGFFQRHVPTVRCRPNGTWERPKIICTKSRRSHRYRRQHHRSRREHRRHRRHGSGHRGRD
ncbi:neurocan core protein-like [Misgurnus anguillicaudatus]|uniref:neurocan core protein-like n=1 Tax=Misgurnus anguillicaudatus TaxID=75329 RepID=UPI003CCF6FC0